MEVVVIGGGQSGLAVSYWLKRQGVAHLVLDAHNQVGDSWRLRWDSLRLFTPNRYNALPGMPFPGKKWGLPDKNEAANYLKQYAKRFDLPVRCGVKVTDLSPGEQGFVLQTDEGEMPAGQVVVAVGPYARPFVPKVAADIPAEVEQVHTSAYQNPATLAGKRVLVVGAGASGQQVARELAEAGRQVWLAGPAVPNLPRNFLGRDIYWWLYNSGIMAARRSSLLGQWLYKRSGGGGKLTVGECMESLVKTGVQRVGRLTGWSEGAEFKDGERLAGIEAVVWATGFRNSYDWIQAEVTDEAGRVRHQGGVSETVPGLYFMGLPFMRRQNSSLMGGVGKDAKAIAKAVAKRAGN